MRIIKRNKPNDRDYGGNGRYCDACGRDIKPKEKYYSSQKSVEYYLSGTFGVEIQPIDVEEVKVLCQTCAVKENVGVDFSVPIDSEDEDDEGYGERPHKSWHVKPSQRDTSKRCSRKEPSSTITSLLEKSKEGGGGEQNSNINEQEADEEEISTLREIVPAKGLADIVLTPSTLKQIEMALVHAKNGSKLLEEWGLGRVFHYGTAIAMSFVGTPGTGKTLAAEVLAKELGKKLLVVKPAQLMNMWVGGTEKRIVQVFEHAQKQDAVLLFDESDSLVSRRTSIEHSGDSYRNNDTNVLLQELEKFRGIVIFATNFAVNLDPALERRVSLNVLFEKPGKEERIRLFKTLVPKEMPLEEGVDFERLAEHELVGGDIKNVVINAARIALHGGAKEVSMKNFQEALEYVLKGKKLMGMGAEEGFSKESFVA